MRCWQAGYKARTGSWCTVKRRESPIKAKDCRFQQGFSRCGGGPTEAKNCQLQQKSSRLGKNGLDQRKQAQGEVDCRYLRGKGFFKSALTERAGNTRASQAAREVTRCLAPQPLLPEVHSRPEVSGPGSCP